MALAGNAFFCDFRNRREVASCAGLAASPWQSGGIDHKQGISRPLRISGAFRYFWPTRQRRAA